MRKYAYELRVVPRGEGDYHLELWAPPYPDSRPAKRRRSAPLSAVEGWHLNLASGVVRRLLEKNKYKASELKRTRREPFRLPEEDAVRLDLAFRAINGLRRRTRIEDILQGIQHMSREETLYWHVKVTSNNGTNAENGLVALRVLLGGQTR